MMKQFLLTSFCMLLIFSLLSMSAVYAQEVDSAPTGAVIELSELGDAAVPDSYTLTEDGESVLEVVHVREPGMTAALSDVTANGYYTASFMIPETNDKVFLTGLTQNNVDEIRQAIVASYTAGANFDMKNLGFIDAEKTRTNDGDENLCWAAACSNILTYTGWAAQAGFDSTDDVFDAFVSAFEDNGGSPLYGVAWFMNGHHGSSTSSNPADGTGRYLPEYCSYNLTEALEMDTTGTANMNVLEDRLHDGCGVTLGVDIYCGSEYEGGHSITCWGLVTDIRYPRTGKAYYKSVIVTDSDSDKYYVTDGMDRRDADDVMHVFALEPIEQDGLDTYTFAISDEQTAILCDAITLVPYSAAIARETDASASCDISTTPDIAVTPFYLTNDASTDALKKRTLTTFAVGDSIYAQPCFCNWTDTDYYGWFQLKLTVTDATGNTVYTRTANGGSSVDILSNYHKMFAPILLTQNQSFGVGDYTLTAEFNPTNRTDEAYYYNNVRSISFKVRETYRLGDVDGDGTVAIFDVTQLQRQLVGLHPQLTDQFDERGDVNANGRLDVLDATIIQRHLVGETSNYNVDVSQFYD